MGLTWCKAIYTGYAKRIVEEQIEDERAVLGTLKPLATAADPLLLHVQAPLLLLFGVRWEGESTCMGPAVATISTNS
jgi:hypothetical protein